jgi:hypothetical protein
MYEMRGGEMEYLVSHSRVRLERAYYGVNTSLSLVHTPNPTRIYQNLIGRKVKYDRKLIFFCLNFCGANDLFLGEVYRSLNFFKEVKLTHSN